MVLMSGQTEKVEYDYLADAPRPEEVTFPPPLHNRHQPIQAQVFPMADCKALCVKPEDQ